MKKITLIATLLLCLSMCLSACSSYRDDVAVNDIATEILNSVSTQGGYTSMDELFLSLEFANPSLIESDVSEWMICASNSQTTVDEFGIFHVKEGGDVDAVKAEVWDYVQATQVKLEVFLDMYEPAEKTKLENAQIEVYGNYVVYTILTQEDTTAATKAVKSELGK